MPDAVRYALCPRAFCSCTAGMLLSASIIICRCVMRVRRAYAPCPRGICMCYAHAIGACGMCAPLRSIQHCAHALFECGRIRPARDNAYVARTCASRPYGTRKHYPHALCACVMRAQNAQRCAHALSDCTMCHSHTLCTHAIYMPLWTCAMRMLYGRALRACAMQMRMRMDA